MLKVSPASPALAEPDWVSMSGQLAVCERLCPTFSEGKAAGSLDELDQALSLPCYSPPDKLPKSLGLVEGVFTSVLADVQFQPAHYMSSVGCASQELNQNRRKICYL